VNAAQCGVYGEIGVRSGQYRSDGLDWRRRGRAAVQGGAASEVGPFSQNGKTAGATYALSVNFELGGKVRST